jgi:NitT/TauT family transport system substrate-binding protein
MIRRAGIFLLLIAGLIAPAAAQERVTVATTRDIGNGALFLAAARGYFKAEGLDLEMRAYPNAQGAAEALGRGATDLGLAAFSATAFSLAGSGKIKMIAAQVREERGYEGNEIVASTKAYAHGLHGLADLASKSIALSELGGIFHYQLAQIARHKDFNLSGVVLRPLHSFDAIAQAVAGGKVDAAILPPLDARDLLASGRARPVGWYSELDGEQLGALFASAGTLASRRAMVVKFLRAYRRGAAAYAAALLRHDSYGKRVFDAQTRAAAAAIGLYLYPGHAASETAPLVAGAAYFMDAQARLDLADLARQLAWFKAQGLIDKNVDAHAMVEANYIAGR